MRLTLCLVLLCLSGCARWVGIESARREALTEAFREQRFPLPLTEAAERLRGGRYGVTTRCDPLPSGELRCGGCARGKCFQLLDEQGFTRVETRAWFSEAELTDLWKPLDPLSFAKLQVELPRRVERKLQEEEAAFVPRFGLTAAVLAGAVTDNGAIGLGGRVGVRRWHTIDLLSHAAFEYRYRGDHELHLRVGLEVARWTEGRFWGGLGVPPASVSMFIGPVLRLPATRAGVRAGAGLLITDWRSAPMFVEVAAETLFVGERSQVVGVFTYGIGI